MSIQLEPHPLLIPAAFSTTFPEGALAGPSPAWLEALLAADALSPFVPSEPLRVAIRDLLRMDGYKPTGRGKPASEYLARAAASEGGIRSINVAVDTCNAASLQSGFPVSVVDLDRARAPFHVRLGVEGESYVFNASGQEIDVCGLLCLCDVEGPCANAVKDSQRTKTDGHTRMTLTVVWGTRGFEERLDQAVTWYRELLGRVGASTESLDCIE